MRLTIPRWGVHRRLRPPRRSRGVDHVRQVRVGEIGVERRGIARHGLLVRIQEHHSPACRHPFGQAADAQDHPWVGIFGEEAQPVAGMGGIQRQIGSSRPEDPEQGDHQLEGALEQHADQHLGADARVAQPQRPCAAELVELPIGQALLLETQRHRVRSPLGLCLEELVQTEPEVPFEERLGVVPLDEELPPLGISEHRKVRDPVLGPGFGKPGEQAAENAPPGVERSPGRTARSRIRASPGAGRPTRRG